MTHENIVKKLSLKLSIGENIIDLIVKDSFKNASRVLSNTDICEVEISGLGKLRISENKLKRRLDKYYEIRESYEERLSSYLSNKETMTDQEYRKLQKRLRSVNNDISNLEKKYLRLNKNNNNSN